MSRGGCNFPEHHGGGDGGSFAGAALLIIVIGAVVAGLEIVHFVLRILPVIAEGVGFIVLGLAAGGGVMLWRRHRQRQTWDGADSGELHGPAARARHLSQYPPPRAIEAPRRTGSDLHLHLPDSMTPGDVADVIRRHSPDGWQ